MFIPRALSTLAVVLWASATFAQQPPAGTVRVRILDAAGGQISSQDYASGSNITVALGLVATPRTVHIFATNTLNQWGNHAPDGGIGTLTITGTANATGRVNIFVADGDETFPSLAAAADALTPGLTTLGGTVNSNASSNGGYAHDYDAAPWATSNSAPSYGGPVFADWGNANLKGIIIPDPSLRRQTVLAAVVAGDICPDANGAGTKGRIEVGQVLRLEAR